MSQESNNQVEPKMLSERSFGLIFGGIFAVIAFWPVVFSGGSPRQWALVIALVWVVVAVVLPIALRPLNILWMKFGFFMHRIINPILMGLVFFVAVFPTGIIRKILGKDSMRRKYEPEASSYWIPRTPESQNKEHFDNQF